MAITTSIWLEEAVPGNEFAPGQSFLFGREFYSDLAPKQSVAALTYLHLTGRIPTPDQEKLLGFILNFAANPGIRDESALAAMNTAIGSPPSVNAVMSGLMARSGLNRGARWVERVMENLLVARSENASLAGFAPFSGLGLHYDHPDIRAQKAIAFLQAQGYWGDFCRLLEENVAPDAQILLEGLIAAAFLDLGITPACGAVLFLLAAGPALAAYALEQQALGYKKFPHYFAAGHYSHSNEPEPGGKEQCP